ncbi:uncharacterized protein DSM5745_06295 [Aspergillus mulundensis]|uniref:Uncharacterized protein n=1 Tax=Aspergillus mulundensis TaxID=1810919 RepID=A0A3D8RQG1_9EURO|nr:hypothetical protein DSM5745_06295 [Aspergillus mulundensis]RDW76303.1 hypothetical protein DSM5745_06295 [Aspergillus mulundensis]
MSFGFSVGDFLAVIELVSKLRKRFVNAPVEFKSLSDEVKHLSVALQNINDFDLDDDLNDKQKKRLNANTEACRETLDSLSTLLDQYQEIETVGSRPISRRRQVWKRLKWDPAPAQDIQRQLQSRIESFNLFFGSLNAEMNISQNATLEKIHQSQRTQEEEKVLQWLTDVDFGAKQTDYIRRRQPGTSEWILQTAEFKHWVDTPGALLFCHGIPGAGKTITAAVVVDYLATRFGNDESVATACIYFNFREVYRHEELFMNLLMQLTSRKTEFPERVKDLHRQHKDRATRPLGWEISEANRSVAATFPKVFIVVDALDECPEGKDYRNMVVDELLKLRATKSVNLFITSRPSPDILEIFSGEVHIEIQATKEDIEVYVHSNLKLLPRVIQRSSDLQQEITSLISNAAEGMFLLAQLYLQALECAVTAREVRTLLAQFQRQSSLQPGEDRKLEMLSKAYDDTMGRIQQLPQSRRQLALDVLMWITSAQQPLTVSQLQNALAVEEGDTEIDDESLPDVQDMVTVCSGLVTVDQETDIIRLVHYTTQEYFKGAWRRWFPHAQSQLTVVCLTYLLFDTFRTGICITDEEYESRLESYPLYEYAANHWQSHYRPGEGNDEHVLEFLCDEPRFTASIQASMTFEAEGFDRYDRDEYSQRHFYGTTSLHYAAKPGLEPILLRLLENGHPPDPRDIHWRTPLICAAHNGSAEGAHILLERGADANAKDGTGNTPLLWAARCGNADVVAQLLPKANNVNAKDYEFGRTALIWAANNGLEEGAVRLLLKHGADVDALDDDNRSALSWAAENGNASIVELLLGHKADATAPDDNGHTPLAHAAFKCHEDIVRLLLPAIRCTNNEGFSAQIPVLPAVVGNSLSILQYLLNEGADLDLSYPDLKGTPRAPLAWAVQHGNEAIAGLLLAHGADVNFKPNYDDETFRRYQLRLDYDDKW